MLAAGFNALTASAVIIDRRGSIVAVNDAWRCYADDNGLRWPCYGIGYNYLSVLDNAARDGVAGVAEIAQGIRRVLRGPVDSFRVEYSCETPSGCQFIHDVTAFAHVGERHAVVSHENVTTQRFNEAELRAAREVAEAAEREEQVRREAAEQRLRVAATVADMLTIASSGQPLETVLQGMVARCSETLGSQAAAVYRAEQRWDWLELVAAHGAAAPGGAAGETPVERAVLSKALAERCGVAIGDLWREPGASGDRPGSASLTGYRALLVTPVERSERFYGYLVHFYAEPLVFDADDLELARTFAQQVTLALENAEWRSQAEKAAVENERSRLARELHDAVTQTLFSASVVAEALPRVWERDPERAGGRWTSLRLWTRGALAEMRTLLMELRPAALIEKPLPDLIRQLSEAAASRLLIAGDLRVDRRS